MPERSYYEQRNLDNLLKIRDIQNELPPWFSEFLRAVENTTSTLTRLNYAYDTRVFLKYLSSENKKLGGVPIDKITTDMLGELTLTDMELYVEYLGYYITSEDVEHENTERGKARKIASLRSIFKYLYKKQHILANPAELIMTPKLHNKAIIRLSPDEVARLVDTVESGEGLSEHQRKFHNKTVKRDVAIIVILLTTGMRVSELVGLDISDVNMQDMCLKITRKGGNQALIYFDYEAEQALNNYIEDRKDKGNYDIPPLFLSLQNTRIGVQAVENLVKKYAVIAAPLKKITPHKLRSTYGSMLYQGTGDIYLVADVLGHKDINTTRRHYADMSEENRMKAAKVVKLRDDVDKSEK